MRFELKRAPWVRPLLSLFGATKDRAFIDVDDARVHIRFGPFDETFSRGEIREAVRSSWSLLGGLGWRWVPGGVGLIGDLSDVVCLRLATPRKVRLFPPLSVRAGKVCLSVERPDDLIAALTAPQPPG